jgi:hypothetical protein
VRLGAILMFFDIFLDFYLFGVFSMRKCVRIWIFSMRKIPALFINFILHSIHIHYTLSYTLYIYIPYHSICILFYRILEQFKYLIAKF